MNNLDQKVDELRTIIDEIGLEVATSYTLADAIREGSSVTEQSTGWGDGNNACALTLSLIYI